MKADKLYDTFTKNYPEGLIVNLNIGLFMTLHSWLMLRADRAPDILLIIWGTIFLFFSTKLIGINSFKYKTLKYLLQIVSFFPSLLIYREELKVIIFSQGYLLSTLTGGILGIVYLYANKENFKMFIDEELIKYTTDFSTSILNDIVSLVQGLSLSIIEEMFFRGIFFIFLGDRITLFILINGLWFSFFHYYTNVPKMFSFSDYLRQIIVSITSSLLLFYTNSITGSVMLHLFVNLAGFIRYIKIIRLKMEE